MIQRMGIPLAFGVIGTLILLALGNWQVNRLAEKQAFLAEIDARIADLPIDLPAQVSAAQDRFLAVEVRGRYTGDEIDVLASAKGIGAAYRVMSVFETEDQRRILIDRGFLPVAQRGTERSFPEARLQGNLHWPQEVDSFTPEPDAATNTWFARDVPALAAALDTEPVLIILRATSEADPFATPYPLDSSGIPNDHLEYAVTWFSLAAVWFGMTLYFLWRMRRSERHSDSPEAE